MAKKKKNLFTIDVEERWRSGKGMIRRLRAQGVVPGIYYDGKGTNIMIRVPEVTLTKVYREVGDTKVFELNITRTDGKVETYPSLIWRVKYDPVKPKVEHVDVYGVDLDKELRISIPIELSGRSKGEEEGGMVELYRDTLEVYCKPMDIPESIVIDVTELDVNDTVNIEDVNIPEGVKVYFDENFAILGVISKEALEAAAEAAEAAMEAEEEAEEGEEGEEGEAEEGEEAEAEESEGE